MLGKISVIVPVYGEDEYLDECIESIVNQTYQNLEIILVDDGSPDKCPQICDKWAEKDKRIKVIHKPNGGLVSARQAGMQEATGEYIGYVDGDDFIEPDMYEHMLKSMHNENVDILITGFKKDLYGKCITCCNPIGIGRFNREQLINEVFPKMICSDKVFRYGLYTYVWNKLFKKEKIYSNQLNVDQRMVVGEDSACVYPTILEADAIFVTDYAGYHYRQRMNSLLRRRKKGNDGILKLKVFYEYMNALLANNEFESVLKEQLYYFYVNHLIMMSDNLVEQYPELGDNFPFFNVQAGSRIIVYGAGAYGIHLYRQFDENEKYEVVAWVDPDYEQYVESEFAVISLEEALKESFDYVVIASVDGEYVSSVEQLLDGYQEAKGKVISINQNIDLAIEKLKENKIIGCEC